MSDTANDYDDLLEDAEHPWRNRLIALAALAVLVAAGVYAVWAMVLSDGGSSAAEAQTATVERGSITNTLSTSGVVVAQSTAELSFDQSGLVTAVNVTLGQEVKEGDVLAEMESDELESALVTAELNLTSAQANLDELLEGPSASDLASADQSLLQAQTSYDRAERALEDLLDGPSESELLSAQQSVSSAESQLAKAEDSRTKVYSASDDEIAAAEEAVERAETALENAEVAADNATSSLSSAKAALYSAETDFCGVGEDVASWCASRGVDCFDTDDVAFCAKRAAPLSTEDEDTLHGITAGDEPEQAAKASQVLAANASYYSALASRDAADDDVESAEDDLQGALDDLEEAKQGPTSDEIAEADASVASAQLSLDIANQKLADLLAGPTQDDLDDAQSDIDQAAASLAVAQAKWDDVYDGPDSLEIEQQRDQVRQAELSVERAREDLEEAKIIAPFDGTVAEVNIEVGQEPSTQQAAIVLNTPDALRLDLVISESDRPDVEVGQSGFASFDALESGTFPFVIDSIGTSPTTTQGVVTYEAWATLQTERSPQAMRAQLPAASGASATPPAGAPDTEAIPSEALEQFAARSDTSATPLPGMNASVTIIVEQVQDVLVVPTQAVQTEGFQSVVEVLNDDGSTEKVSVQTGVTDGTSTEITEGLVEGQTVMVPTRIATAVETTTSSEFQQGGFGPGGFTPPEGFAPREGSAP